MVARSSGRQSVTKSSYLVLTMRRERIRCMHCQDSGREHTCYWAIQQAEYPPMRNPMLYHRLHSPVSPAPYVYISVLAEVA